jgi:hypothetical protein
LIKGDVNKVKQQQLKEKELKLRMKKKISPYLKEIRP